MWGTKSASYNLCVFDLGVWTIMVGLLIVLMEKCQISPEVIATQRWGVENVGMK